MASYIGLFQNTAGVWHVSFPNLPECTAEADGYDAAMRAARAALVACLADRDEPPEPRTAIDLVRDARSNGTSLSLANMIMRSVSTESRLDGAGQ